MSVQGEIDRIKKNVDDTLKVISDTGVTVGTDSNALPAAARALANEKQDKLTGTAGQFVGFGPDGNATPKNVTAGDVTFSDGKTFQQKYDAGQLTGPVGPPGPQGPKGIQGPAGANGKSPYQVAVEEGYTGTESDFNSALVAVPQKADRVQGGTAGNFASLSETGNLVDSGKKPSDFAAAGLSRNVTLYVNASTGNDGNDGLSSSKAKQTIMAAINSLPKNLGGYGAIIQIADGTYNESVSVNGFFGSGSVGIQIIGASQNTKITAGFRIEGCSVKVQMQNLSISGAPSGTVVFLVGSLYCEISSCNIDASDAGKYGLITEYTNISLYNISVSNYQGNYGAIVANGSVIQANLLNGSNNKVGIIAGSDASGTPGLVIVGTDSMAATIKYQKVRGGAIIENGVLI